MLAACLIGCAPIPLPDANRDPAASAAVEIDRLDVGDLLPPFRLLASDGRIVEPGDLPGDVLIIAFYSSSGASADSSRVILRRLEELFDRLRPERRARVHLLAVALDPDSTDALPLEQEALRLREPAWTIATAPPPQLERLAASLGVVTWSDSTAGFDHTLATTIVASGRIADRFLGVAEWSVTDLLGAVSSAMTHP